MLNPFKNPNSIKKLAIHINHSLKNHSLKKYPFFSMFKGMETDEIVLGPVALGLSGLCFGTIFSSEFLHNKNSISPTSIACGTIGASVGFLVGCFPGVGPLLGGFHISSRFFNYSNI